MLVLILAMLLIASCATGSKPGSGPSTSLRTAKVTEAITFVEGVVTELVEEKKLDLELLKKDKSSLVFKRPDPENAALPTVMSRSRNGAAPPQPVPTTPTPRDDPVEAVKFFNQLEFYFKKQSRGVKVAMRSRVDGEDQTFFFQSRHRAFLDYLNDRWKSRR
jgi:hypothetical protein